MKPSVYPEIRRRQAVGPLAYVLYALGALIPLICGLYWPAYSRHPFGTAAVLRPALLGAAVLTCLACGGFRVSKAEAKLVALLGAFSLLWLGTSLAAVDFERSVTDWVKLLLICVFGVILSRALRNRHVAKGFGVSLVISSLIVGAFILVSYVRFEGFTFPTYTSVRQFKGIAQFANIPLNTIPFAAVLAYLEAMCLLRPNRLLWAIGGVLFLICSLFTGSRAPLAVLLASGAVLLLINWLRSKSVFIRYSAIVLTTTALIGLPVLFCSVPFRIMSELTEGRWDLWHVAIHKFAERPILGFGLESVHDDLLARMPGVYKFKSVHEVAGGYHNEYLTALTEEGVVGFLPVIAVCWFLTQSCFQLAFGKWMTWKNGQWALFTALFMLIRACLEVPGIFGYAREPVDFLAYAFLALIVSRFSIEEGCARQLDKGRRKSPSGLGSVPYLPVGQAATAQLSLS